MPEIQMEIFENLKTIYPFNQIDKQDLEEISNNGIVLKFKRGDKILHKDKLAEKTYILIEGNIELINDYNEMILKKNMIFGLESFNLDRTWEFDAVALNDVKIIEFDTQVLIDYLNIIDSLNTGFELLIRSNNLSKKLQFPWKKNDESIIYIGRQHIFFMLKKLIIPLILFLILIGFAIYQIQDELIPGPIFYLLLSFSVLFVLIWSLFIFVDWRRAYSIVTDKRIIKQKILLPLHESRQEALMTMVLSVGVGTDMISRWLNFGNINIRTYAGLIVFPGLENPYAVSSLIQTEWFKHKNKSFEVENNISKENLLRKRLGMQVPENEKQIDKNNNTVKKDVPRNTSNNILDVIARFLQIRIDTGKEIVYRTHWYIILKKIIIPTLLLVILQFLYSLELSGGGLLIKNGDILFIFYLILDLGLIVWWIYNYIDWRNDIYILTNEFIVDVYKKPLGKEERKSAPLRNIQSIEFEREGIIGLLLNFGTVHILVGETELTFDNVYNPSQVQNDIFNHVFKREEEKSLKLAKIQDEQIEDWIEAYHKATTNDQ